MGFLGRFIRMKRGGGGGGWGGGQTCWSLASEEEGWGDVKSMISVVSAHGFARLPDGFRWLYGEV